MIRTPASGFAGSGGWSVLRGLAAIAFGVLALVLPGPTIAALVLLWGAWMLADGLLALLAAWRMRDGLRRSGPMIVVGLLGIAAGLVTYAWPGLTALALLLVAAGWAIATGVLQILAAIRLRKVIEHEWWMAAGGILSIVFGVLTALNPAAGAIAIAWTVGVYALMFGVSMVMLGVRLRRAAKHGPLAPPAADRTATDPRG